jgi:hypothetical protein
MCVAIFYRILSETFVILRGIRRDIVINVHRSSSKAPLILVRFESNLNFLDIFSKNHQTGRPRARTTCTWTSVYPTTTSCWPHRTSYGRRSPTVQLEPYRSTTARCSARPWSPLRKETFLIQGGTARLSLNTAPRRCVRDSRLMSTTARLQHKEATDVPQPPPPHLIPASSHPGILSRACWQWQQRDRTR